MRLEAESGRYFVHAGSIFYDCNVQSNECSLDTHAPTDFDVFLRVVSNGVTAPFTNKSFHLRNPGKICSINLVRPSSNKSSRSTDG
jgi:hypothetical protein